MLSAAGAGMLLAMIALPALGEWEFRYEADSSVHVLIADGIHHRLIGGTDSGFVYLDIPSDQWTAVNLPGPDDPVYAIAWNPSLAERLLLGHGGGDIALTQDLGMTSMVVYEGPNLTYITDIERDPLVPYRFFACSRSWDAENVGSVLRSVNDGLSWQVVLHDDARDWTCLALDAGGTVYAGGEGGIVRSFDGGTSWEPADGGMPAGHVYCLDAVQCGVPGRVFAGNSYDLYASTDSGGSWQPLPLGHRCEHVAVHDHTPAILAAHLSWGVGPPDYVFLSYDGGASWTNSHFDWVAQDWSSLYALEVSTNDQSVYGNTFDQIYSYQLDITAVPAPPAVRPAVSAWPNPFNPRTTIAVDLGKEVLVSLRIYDLKGALVRRLLEMQRHPAGSYEIDWDGRDDAGCELASGVFMIRLDAGAQSVMCKATLLK